MRRKHAKELKKIKKSFEWFREKIKINYYKPIRTKGPFNNNYIEYESRGDKDKNLSPEDYLNIMRPYNIFIRLMNKYLINIHTTHGE